MSEVMPSILLRRMMAAPVVEETWPPLSYLLPDPADGTHDEEGGGDGGGE